MSNIIGEKSLDVNTEYNKLLEGNGRKLTNMDEFTTAADHFREFGTYTRITPNPRPNSKYRKLWDEEARRCIHGYHAGHDYIPGYYYWYLNYSPIWRTVELGEKDPVTGMVKSERMLDFPAVWDGDYYYYHYINEAEASGEHGVVLKTRGRGYSFKGASKLARNYFLFPGSKSYAFAHQKEYLTKDGLLTKAWENLDWVDSHTPWAKKRHYKDQDMHKRASFKKTINGTAVEKGFKSEIIGVTFNDNPDVARGKRGKLILWEEFGSFPHALKSWRLAINSMKQGRSVFGLMVAYGTGGEQGADFEAMQEMFSNPKGHQVHPMTNVLDENKYGTQSAFFAPDQLNREGHYDKNGNSDITSALKEINDDRTKIIENSSDPLTIIRAKAEEPTKPQEAMLRTTGNNFPVNDLMERRSVLEASPEKYEAAEWVGRLFIGEDGKINPKRSRELKPIKEFPLKGSHNIEGAIQIFEPPIKNGDGNVPHGIYIAATDPYDHDESTTDSLGSTFILNLLTDRIVTEYTGRPGKAEEYYENVRRLCMYYNAKNNYENNLKGMFTYFKNKNSLHLLAPQPGLLKDIVNSTTLNRQYGTPGTKTINKYARTLINSWLKTDTIDKDGWNLHKIRSIPLLKELELWNIDKNFDRVSALGMLMIYREELKGVTPEEVAKIDNKKRRRINKSFLGRSFKGKNLHKNMQRNAIDSQDNY